MRITDALLFINCCCIQVRLNLNFNQLLYVICIYICIQLVVAPFAVAVGADIIYKLIQMIFQLSVLLFYFVACYVGQAFMNGGCRQAAQFAAASVAVAVDDVCGAIFDTKTL